MGLFRSSDIDRLISGVDGGPLTDIYKRTLAALDELGACTPSIMQIVSRALCEAAEIGTVEARAAPASEIRHTYQPSLGGVRVKYETNSRGTNTEVSVDRPRAADETYEWAVARAVELAKDAYQLAQEAIGAPTMPITVMDGGKA